jgi:D-alanyl-D-alanine carboxypeptidase/D-alanyl-D-alanine-endopeptidase (penicillin-binding protein 4)
VRRALLLTLLALSALVPVQAAQAGLKSSLTAQMRQAGSHSGAYVMNLSTGEQVFAWRAGVPRVLASNAKLFVSAAVLARFGTEGTLGTEVLGRGELGEDGIWRGDLYLRGGGGPTFGSRRFATRSYGGGATVEELAALVDEAGIERVTGRVYGDESRHDSLRGGPYSAFGVSIWVGPLSALSFNRGLGW